VGEGGWHTFLVTDPIPQIQATEPTPLPAPAADVTPTSAPVEPSPLPSSAADVTPDPASTEQFFRTQMEGTQTGTSDPWTGPVFLGMEWNGSALVALFALAVAVASAVFTGKNWRISKNQEDRKAVRIEPTIRRSMAWRDADGVSVWIGALTSIEHPSDRDGSISRVELVIELADSGSLRFDHEPSMSEDEGKYMGVPSPLPANDTKLGWFTFKVPEEFYCRPAAGRYLEIRDGRGVDFKKQLDILMEVGSDPTSRA